MGHLFVIPAQAGTSGPQVSAANLHEAPAFAGVTVFAGLHEASAFAGLTL